MSVFGPVFGPLGHTVTIHAGPVSQATDLRHDSNRLRTVLMQNAGPAVVFVAFGGAGVEATPASVAVLPGVALVFRFPDGATHVAAVTAEGEATVFCAPGFNAV